MRPQLYTLGAYAAGGTAVLAALQGGTSQTALTLVGVGGGPSDPFVNDVPRTVTITSVGNESGNRFSIRGNGPKGNEIYESITGANIGVVETQLIFASVISITPEFDTAANVSAGTVSAVPSPWIPLDYIADDAPVSVSLFVPAAPAPGGISATVELAMDQLGYNNADPKLGGWHGSVFDIVPPTLVPFAPVAAITLAAAGNEAEQLAPNPATAVRFLNAGPITAGTVTLRVVQGVRNVAGW